MLLKQVIGVFLTVIILFMAGCDRDDTLIEEQQNQLKELSKIVELEDIIKEQQNQLKELKGKIVELEDIINEQQKIIDDQNKEFSYLNGFTKEELEAYENFVQDKDTQHLLGLSPEKMMLIYYHSVVIGDVEAIYLLTYNDGTLPDLSTFRQKYYKEGTGQTRNGKHTLLQVLQFN